MTESVTEYDGDARNACNHKHSGRCGAGWTTRARESEGQGPRAKGQGPSLNLVQEEHGDISMTLNQYSHVTPDMQLSAADTLDVAVPHARSCVAGVLGIRLVITGIGALGDLLRVAHAVPVRVTTTAVGE